MNEARCEAESAFPDRKKVLSLKFVSVIVSKITYLITLKELKKSSGRLSQTNFRLI